MKNEDLENYYTTVLAAAYINVEMLEVAGRAPSDDVIAQVGAMKGFNRTAFVEDVKAVTKVIVARKASVTKFDSINIEP